MKLMAFIILLSFYYYTRGLVHEFMHKVGSGWPAPIGLIGLLGEGLWVVGRLALPPIGVGGNQRWGW